MAIPRESLVSIPSVCTKSKHKRMTTIKQELEYVRLFKTLIDNLAEKRENQIIYKKEIDLIYQKLVTRIDAKLKQEVPDLSMPQVTPITLGGIEYFVHKNTHILFTKTIMGEYVAVGKLLDNSKILLLRLEDLITCVGNGWRFKIGRAHV